MICRKARKWNKNLAHFASIYTSLLTLFQKKRSETLATSKRRSITRFIWAPTVDFLILLICWSLFVSFENFSCGCGCWAEDGAGAWGFFALLLLLVVVFFGVGLDAATFVKVFWQFTCYCLNLSNFLLKSICRTPFTPNQFTVPTNYLIRARYYCKLGSSF